MKKNYEDYILAVWEIMETNDRVLIKDVGERLKTSGPTAWEELHRLKSMGFITFEKEGVKFTEIGYQIAKRIIMNHRIAELFVYKMLEVPWQDAHEEVMEFEHSLKDILMDKLWKNMGNPLTCPHGNPINPEEKGSEINLNEVSDGKYKLKRITYEDHTLLRNLASNFIFPGTEVMITKYDKGWEISGPNGKTEVNLKLVRSIRLM